MKKVYMIGVDIGGTNTDAVLVDEQEKIVYAIKTPTTQDISQGFLTALKQLITPSGLEPKQIQGVFVGTTHATNAILPATVSRETLILPYVPSGAGTSDSISNHWLESQYGEQLVVLAQIP